MWLLLLASIWGASYMLIKIGLRDLSAPMIAGVRIGLAAAVLVPLAASQGALGAFRGRAGTIVILGAVQVAGPFLLIALGEQEISSALAGILVATAPIFTAVLAIWVDHEERSEGARLFGIVLAIFYTLIGRVGPARSFIVAYLAPGFAVVYGGVLLDERITPATVGGLALILAGSWLAVEGSIPWRRGEAAALPDSAPRPAPSAARPGG